MKPIRIWYQSYVDEEHGKTYWDRLRRHLADLVDPGTAVDIRGITPHDNYAHPIVEFRCAREVICNAVKAEREGYDAFVVGHFQDAGLYEARSVVDIPVVALGEASMLHACQLGQRSGIVTINPRFIPWFHHQIGKYGLEKRVTGVHAMTFEPGQTWWSCLQNRRGRWSPQVATCSFRAAAFRCCCLRRSADTPSTVPRSSTASRSW
jgi:allantoin racemase